MIWMHGLGARYDDMVGLVEELQIEDKPIRHVFLQAPDRPVTINNQFVMPAWYDIVGTSLTDREDEKGIKDSRERIMTAVNQEIEKGVDYPNILLAGFSQGGAMALYTGLTLDKKLGGIVGLSCYLPLAEAFDNEGYYADSMPIFLAYGELDPIVWPIWSRHTHEKLRQMGFNDVTFRGFPMMHSVCGDELLALRAWLDAKISG